jgi:hypothetical protein
VTGQWWNINLAAPISFLRHNMAATRNIFLMCISKTDWPWSKAALQQRFNAAALVRWSFQGEPTSTHTSARFTSEGLSPFLARLYNFLQESERFKNIP